jgi:hypothetical protein
MFSVTVAAVLVIFKLQRMKRNTKSPMSRAMETNIVMMIINGTIGKRMKRRMEAKSSFHLLRMPIISTWFND